MPLPLLEQALQRRRKRKQRKAKEEVQAQDKGWVQPERPVGLLRKLLFQSKEKRQAKPSFLPVPKRPHKVPPKSEYVFGDGCLGPGWYSVETKDAYLILIGRLGRAKAILQSERNSYDNCGCFWTGRFWTPKATKERHMQALEDHILTAHNMTRLLEMRYNAPSPYSEIPLEVLRAYDIDPKTLPFHQEDDVNMQDTINTAGDVLDAVGSIMEMAEPYVRIKENLHRFDESNIDCDSG